MSWQVKLESKAEPFLAKPLSGCNDSCVFRLGLSFPKMNETKLQELCRVCLTCSSEMVDLQSEVKEVLEDDIRFVYQALGRVLKKEVVLDASYPSYICRVCYSFLNLSYKFVVDCERSETVLKEHFKLSVFEDISENKRSVELISVNGKFDVKDLLIVEEVDEKPDNFDAFLSNLGTEISAVFVKNEEKQIKKEEPSSYNITITKTEVKEETVEEIEVIEEKEEEDSSETLNKHQCNICDKVFKKRSYLQRHIKYAHIKISTCLCSECGYFAKTPTSLRYHMHAKHSERKYQCNHCEKRFIAMGHLQTHLLSHTNSKAYLCTVCGKSFNYGNSLEYHMRTHTGEKRYECKHCSKKFAVSSALSRHLLSHTGFRPHKCRYCDKAFRSTGERSCHERLHTGDRPYHCKHCGKRFIKNYNLQVHLLTHKGKHQCEMCDKTFIEVDYLNTHLKIAHRKKVIEENDNLE